MSAKHESIIKDIILTVVTLGFWNLWVQCRQMSDVSELIGYDRFPSSMLTFFLLVVITFGLYLVYHEFIMTREIHKLNFGESYTFLEVSFGVLTFIGLWFIVDAYQQSLLNRYIEKRA